MSALTKWNPFRTSREIEEWGPLARWSPFREMERMQREIDRLFNGGVASLTGGKEAMTITEWAPCVDISEDDKEFLVESGVARSEKRGCESDR